MEAFTTAESYALLDIIVLPALPIMKKLLFVVSEDSYFCSHRLNLAKAAVQAGFNVAVATTCKTHTQPIQDAGIQIFPLKHFTKTDLNPLRQLLCAWELLAIYRFYQPDIVHHVAIKLVVLGAFVARFCRVPYVVNALGGLGYLFTEPNLPPPISANIQDDLPSHTAEYYPNTRHSLVDISLAHISLRSRLKTYWKPYKKRFLRYVASRVFYFVFKQPNSVLILQNADDATTLFNAQCIHSNTHIKIIQGAGIDVTAFSVRPFPPASPVIVRCISRMLWDKGIRELIEAAKILKKTCPSIHIELHGLPDPENPTAIPTQDLLAWHHAGIITWHGHCPDVATAYANCHIAVLPSYREGLPKSLLEAASCGRPIVTTDTPGCREVVQDGENGFLVPARNSAMLADALARLGADAALQTHMGQAGRKRVERYFTDTLIHAQTLELYNSFFQ